MKSAKLMIATGFTLAVFATTSPAEATSFNCRYAKLAAEIAICQDGRLSRLDERMASKYYRLQNRLPYSYWRQIKISQRGWLRSRNRCGYNFRCIENAYYARIRYLNRWLQSY